MYTQILIFCVLIQNCVTFSIDNILIDFLEYNKTNSFLITSECRNDIEFLIKRYYELDIWALKMLDSSGKLGSGVLSGNIKMLGHYDQCVMHQSRDLSAQYCLATLQVNPSPQHTKHKEIKQIFDMATLGRAQYEIMEEQDNLVPDYLPTSSKINLGICVPSSCSAKDVQNIINTALQDSGKYSELEISGRVNHYDCSTNTTEIPWTNFDIAFVAFLILLVVFSVIATVLDNQADNFTKSAEVRKYFQFFSITKNWDQLMNTSNSGRFASINGIRVITTLLVLAVHKMIYHLQEPYMNTGQLKQILTYKCNLPLVNSFTLVDTFFLISGLLRGYGLLQDYQNKRSNFINSLWKRFLRLTPCVAVIIGFYISIAPRLGSGPYWHKTIMTPTREVCTENWIYNLLFINNYVNNRKVCVGQTWYLAADMHLFILAPLLIYPAWRWPNKAIKIFTSTIITGILINFIYIYYYSMLPTILLNASNQKVNDFVLHLHYPTHHRIAVYTIGLALSYVLFSIRNKSVQLSKIFVIVGWTLSFIAMYAVIFGAHRFFQYEYKYDVIEMSLYGALHRPVWVVAVAWIIFACYTGYGGIQSGHFLLTEVYIHLYNTAFSRTIGLINSILSAKIFQPLNKLSYSIFLTHFIFIMINTGKIRNSNYIDAFDIIRILIGDIFITIFASTFLHIFIEAPVLEFINNNMKNTDKPAEKIKTGNNSSIIKTLLKQISSTIKNAFKLKLQ